VSVDEKFILSAQKDGSLSLWSTSTGEEVVKHNDHKDRVNCCAFSGNGLDYMSCTSHQLILLFFSTVGASDGRVNIYRVATKQLMKLLESNSGANGSLFSSLFYCSISSLGCNFSPDCSLAAVGYDDNSVVIYSLSDYSIVNTLTKHSAPVNCVAWSPLGDRLVSGILLI
jgi:WD40 repeat protein